MARSHSKRGSVNSANRKSGIGGVRYKSNAGFHGGVGAKGSKLDTRHNGKRGKRK